MTEIAIGRAISNILEFAQDNQYMDIETITALEQAAANSNIANEALVKLLNIIQDVYSRTYIANAVLKLNINNQKALKIIYYALENIDNEIDSLAQ